MMTKARHIFIIGILLTSLSFMFFGCSEQGKQQINDKKSSSENTSKSSNTEEVDDNSREAGADFMPVMEKITGVAPFPEEILNHSEDEKDQQREAASDLMAEINAAIQNGDSEYVIKPGYYRFGTTIGRMLLYDVNDFSIIGKDVHFIQEGTGNLIQLENCINLKISGITLDYANLPFIQGVVTEVDPENKTVSFAVDENYSALLKGNAITSKETRVLFYKADDYVREVLFSINSFLKTISMKDDGTYSMNFTDNLLFDMKADVQPGDKVAIPVRGPGMAIYTKGCEKLVFEDVSVYCSPGMGIGEFNGKGGNLYKNVKIVRRPGTDRLMTAAADGFHSYMMEKGPTLDGCEISYTEDDLLNIHGFVAFVYEKISDTEFLIATPFQRTYNVGSELNFIETKTGENLGKAKIISMKKETAADVRKLDQIMKEKRNIHVRTFPEAELYRVVLDSSVRAEQYDIADCSDICGAGAVIKNSYFHDGHVRGLVLHGPDVIVENNVMERINMQAVYLVGGGIWAEGPFPHGVTIRYNTISEVGNSFNAQIWPGAIAVFGEHNVQPAKMMKNTILHRDIIVKKNIFKDNGVGAFFGYNLEDSQITGNIIDNPFAIPVSRPASQTSIFLGMKDPYYAIYLESSRNIIVKDNQFINMSENVKGELGVGEEVTGIIEN